MTTADLDIRDRCLNRTKRLQAALEAECDLNDHMEKVQQIALEALEDILESPVENSHGLARIALDRIRAL
jgi:hypothetical protein